MEMAASKSGKREVVAREEAGEGVDEVAGFGSGGEARTAATGATNAGGGLITRTLGVAGVRGGNEASDGSDAAAALGAAERGKRGAVVRVKKNWTVSAKRRMPVM